MGKVRIIGGEKRRHYLKFPDLLELRPTTDRIRETLFNWLNPHIYSAKCLDLFAGSGALSIEALSRGAQFALMIDHKPELIKALNENLTFLGFTEKSKTLLLNFPYNLPSSYNFSFDVIFLDPPYKSNLLALSIKWLEDNKLLHAGSLIYIETSRQEVAWQKSLPIEWKNIKSSHTANIQYYLYQRA